METRSKIHEAVTIVGYLDPIDEKKKEAGILITTDDEDFIVELDKEGKRLMNLIGEKVQVKGTVTKTKGGKSRIIVNTFEVIEWQEPYENDLDASGIEEVEHSDY